MSLELYLTKLKTLFSFCELANQVKLKKQSKK